MSKVYWTKEKCKGGCIIM